MACDEKVDSHIPAFESMTNTLRRIVMAKKRREQALTKAGSLCEEIKNTIKSGKTFAEAAKQKELQFVTTESFTWFTAPTNLPASDDLLQNVAAASQGEFIEPLLSSNTVIIAYVESRTLGDPSVNRDFQKYVGDSLRQHRAAQLFQDWQNRFTIPKTIQEEMSSESETNSEPNEVQSEPQPLPVALQDF
jgi:hypothetical protein